MAAKKVNSDKISLVGLRITKSYFEVNPSFIDEPSLIENIKIGCKSESGFNLAEKHQLFRLFVKIQGIDEKESEVRVKAEYHIDFHYIIENLDDFITNKENEDDFSVDSNLGATIAGISYSTSRGIILQRTQTTDFDGVILPIINPLKLLKEDTFSELE